MAHADYDCCAVCTSKQNYNQWNPRHKGEICTDCLKVLRALEIAALDPAELIEWMKEHKDIARSVLVRIGYRLCLYTNEVDDIFNSLPEEAK